MERKTVSVYVRLGPSAKSQRDEDDRPPAAIVRLGGAGVNGGRVLLGGVGPGPLLGSVCVSRLDDSSEACQILWTGGGVHVPSQAADSGM